MSDGLCRPVSEDIWEDPCSTIPSACATIARAETEDLLDRVTVYRAGMEPDALYVIEEELRQRGVTAADIDEHAQRREEGGIEEVGGLPAQCSFCARPAVVRRWGWHRLGGRWLPDGPARPAADLPPPLLVLRHAPAAPQEPATAH